MAASASVLKEVGGGRHAGVASNGAKVPGFSKVRVVDCPARADVNNVRLLCSGSAGEGLAENDGASPTWSRGLFWLVSKVVSTLSR